MKFEGFSETIRISRLELSSYTGNNGNKSITHQKVSNKTIYNIPSRSSKSVKDAQEILSPVIATKFTYQIPSQQKAQYSQVSHKSQSILGTDPTPQLLQHQPGSAGARNPDKQSEAQAQPPWTDYLRSSE